MAKETKAADLRGKSDGELAEMVKSAKHGLFEARFQNYTNKLNDTSRVGKLRREMSRIHTVMTERRNAAAKPATGAPTKGEG